MPRVHGEKHHGAILGSTSLDHGVIICGHAKKDEGTLTSSLLHVGVELVLDVCSAKTFALESADTLETAGDFALVSLALAENFQDARFLELLFKAALEPFV